MWMEVKVLYWLVRFSPTCFWSSDPSATRVFFFFLKKSDLVGWSHGDRGIVDGSKGLSLSGSTIKLSPTHFASGLVLLLSGSKSNHPI